MTSTQFYGATSLDGFIATPDHDLGWLLQFGEIEGSSYPAFIREVGALAMGSHTYRCCRAGSRSPHCASPRPPSWAACLPSCATRCHAHSQRMHCYIFDSLKGNTDAR